ncbi:ABC-2 family transporter protein [Aquisphaera giovannonii]|uniref:ABC-2 family transporter protein n=1 Tax=Aquisphaera giovannonii TaxID=406548 RepID=A0A5B9WC98_9BACT|nr:ABC transporter permease [Aquisphaera giovannonii]QEH38113.1 ABC-2 family transporter protein [Aquisphaera giovannonii]
MKADVRKIWVVASTEFGSAIRTKSFLIGILLLPIIMGASILLQVFVAERVDTKPRRFVVIDHTGVLAPVIEKAAKAHNEALPEARGKHARPSLVMEPAPTIGKAAPGAGTGEEKLDPDYALALSDRIRNGDLDAFVEIPATVVEPGKDPAAKRAMEYHSDNPNDDVLRNWLNFIVNAEVRARRFRAAGIDQALAERLSQPVEVENLELVERRAAAATGAGGAGEAGRGEVKAAGKVDQVRTALVPAALLFSMFFVIMTSAPQLLNSVIEEKMSRISEVMLGSVTPFELMMGKLVGNAGIAMVLATLYLGGGMGVAAYHGYGDILSPGLVAALVFFLILAVLLYGSMYIAVGSACSELKDAQSLMMPVMLLSMLPVFVWTAVLRNPASPLSVGMSLFPPASPFLMLMRLALKPAPPAWQVGLAVVLTALTTLAIVWAAGKIFRTGLLMQGKAPTFAELARWVMTK